MRSSTCLCCYSEDHAAALALCLTYSSKRTLFQPHTPHIQVAACIKLLGALVQSGSNVSSVMGRSDPRQTGGSMPVEVLRALRDAGAVKALARTLELVDMHHPQV